MMQDPLQRLALLDPDLAAEIRDITSGGGAPVPETGLDGLVEETLRWISVEVSFGYAVARGYARLLGRGRDGAVSRYREMVADAAREGPHLGRLMADHLPPVLAAPADDLPDRFTAALSAMRRKGAYTLKSPLEALSRLLEGGDLAGGSAFLDLLSAAFSHEMPYGQSLHLTHALPRSVLMFPPEKRWWRIRALIRAVAPDIGLADPFLDGLENGLDRLDREGLDRFVREGLARFRTDPRSGFRFFSLKSRLALETLDRLRKSVTLFEARSELTRYLRARTGFPLSVRPMSDLSGLLRSAAGEDMGNDIAVLSDGRSIYLPEEIDRFGDRGKNRGLYKCLVKLESALYEFGTFHFDLERAADLYGMAAPTEDDGNSFSDLDRFAAAFPQPELARDLFTTFEHGRLRLALARSYPGILRQADPLLRAEAKRIRADDGAAESPVDRLYGILALGLPDRGGPDPDLGKIVSRFSEVMTPEAPVEACALLVRECYGIMAGVKGAKDFSPLRATTDGRGDYRPLKIPFGRRLPFDLAAAVQGDMDRTARAVKETLEKHGVKVYKSDIRAHLAQNAGTLSLETLESLVRPETMENRSESDPASGAGQKIDIPNLAEILGDRAAPTMPEEDEGGPAFRHREWDCRIGDYLADHVRVREHRLSDAGPGFYRETLERHPGLVRRIRYAFELLRPQGSTLLRQWVEGDDFDYRALLDFAVDRKSGRTPSDRLYIKRVKGGRDVAVLLLVDLSRSTANPAAGGEASVLDVEKAAIVLFCEALQVVGDAFAVAGFSGTGRLGVDYYRIKDFDEDPADAVRGRIAAMTPRRSTRMGAAIRHGTERLAAVPAAVRILLVLGDGFPNDVDYKREYAIEDTRKAILEAGARRIHTRAITVNIAQETGLDDLYGPLHHNVISDVRELPDKLLRIYSALTRT